MRKHIFTFTTLIFLASTIILGYMLYNAENEIDSQKTQIEDITQKALEQQQEAEATFESRVAASVDEQTKNFKTQIKNHCESLYSETISGDGLTDIVTLIDRCAAQNYDKALTDLAYHYDLLYGVKFSKPLTPTGMILDIETYHTMTKSEYKDFVEKYMQ